MQAIENTIKIQALIMAAFYFSHAKTVQNQLVVACFI